tara:strand:+ start:4746 stop:5600 length:855 start_codon:yes stop_codon:yes gene_type:complete
MSSKHLPCWPAPAKINLFLHICGEREDGYHELQTLFQFLDYADQLQFEILPTADIELKTPFQDVPHEENLIVRAARLLQSYTGCTQGAHIWINKILPQGGGLGGGSSNAATTLVALNHLWQCHVPLPTLRQLGQQLGADVPVFVQGQCAFAEGIGEQLTATDYATPWYLVISPNEVVHTAPLFAHPELPRNTPKISWNEFRFEDSHNDFQTLVLKSYPKVAKAFNWLVQYAPTRMTGTGACIFATFATYEQALEIYKKCPDELCGFIAQGLNRSPLLNVLEQAS